MKKKPIPFFEIITFILLIVYGCKMDSNNAKSQSIKLDTLCNCDKLNRLNRKIVIHDSIKYNGSCFIKDKYDSIVEISFFKNGDLLRRIERKRVYGSYITIFDMTFDQKEMYLNGFKSKMLDEKYDNTEITRVESSEIWENGKKINSYFISLGYWQNVSFSISLKYEFKDGIEIKYPLTNKELKQPKCLPNSEYDDEHDIANKINGTGDYTGTYSSLGDNWSQKIDLTNGNEGMNQAYQIMECLKTELPNFHFIKKN
jgi:hypothetical protein